MGSGSSKKYQGQPRGTAPESAAAVTEQLSDDSTITTSHGKRYSVKSVRNNLIRTGLSSEEVEAALSRVAEKVEVDPSGQGEISTAELGTSFTAGSLVDAVQLYSLLDERKKSISTASSPLHRRNSFNWVERCELLMEEEAEADYASKKMLAAQVRAFLARSSVGAPSLALGDQVGAPDDGDGSSCSDGEEDDEDYESLPPLMMAKSVKSMKCMSIVKLQYTAERMFDMFLGGDKVRFQNKFVRTLLDKFLHHWKAMYNGSSLVNVNAPEDGVMIVVGDTHGQLQDVLTIFLQHGPPSRTTRYLFNGDIADRGPQATEIFLLLFAYFLEEPKSILINRGNHEDEEMNMLPNSEGGGFRDEVLKKYTPGILNKFVSIFKALPLATVVSGEVLVLHGGLPRNAKTNLSLPYIASIDASRVCCPTAGADLGPKEQAFAEILWSDPVETLGIQANPRGTGILWGPDLTSAFLRRTGLKLILRSHQVPKEGRGWSEHHLGLVYTVFSASNYMGSMGNQGAVALLRPKRDKSAEGARLDVSFVEFYAAYLSPGKLMEIKDLPTKEARLEALRKAGVARAAEDREGSAQLRQQAILDKMGARVVEKRVDLWEAFLEMDDTRHGLVCFSNWLEIVTAICGDHFPWSLAWESWHLGCTMSRETSPVSPSSRNAEEQQARLEGQKVDYRNFLGRFQVCLSEDIWCSWRPLLMKELYATLFKLDKGLQETLTLFDHDGDGKVTVTEFMSALKRQTTVDPCGKRVPLLTMGQIHALVRGLFPASQKAEDGMVQNELDVHAFFSYFVVVYRQAVTLAGGDPLAEWRQTLSQLGKLMHVEASSASDSPLHKQPSAGKLRRLSDVGQGLFDRFAASDSSQDGFLQVDEFIEMMLALPGLETVTHEGQPMDTENLEKLWDSIASLSGNGTRVNFFEFLEAFVTGCNTNIEADDEEMGDGVYEHILSMLYRHRHALCSGCVHADPSGSGRLSSADFAEVLSSVDAALSSERRLFSGTEITSLSEALADEDGTLSYVSLLTSLSVRDTLVRRDSAR
eukprot:TRINITY_DN7198_c0_g3_i1.p1 TRINITY_DN7198_c0_g3~~TRINITY_DN7198_c0_g3_i1.p1  ORF type:complete len:1038 (+),score=224.35 TRINITY_DN7198_c0_g3_i1:87-3200(+)